MIQMKNEDSQKKNETKTDDTQENNKNEKCEYLGKAQKEERGYSWKKTPEMKNQDILETEDN